MSDGGKSAADRVKAIAAKHRPAEVSDIDFLDPGAGKPAVRGLPSIEDDTAGLAYRFAFIGAGQGGGRMAEAFYKRGYRRTCLFNTTDQDFKGIDEKIPRLELRVGGAAKDMQFAARHLDSNREAIRDLCTAGWGSGVDYAMVCAGLGGGSGSGTAPGLVRLIRDWMSSHDMTPRVGAVVSLPLVSEGQRVCRNAVTTFVELLKLRVSPLVIVDNMRINQLYRPSMSELFPKANNSASILFDSFNQFAGQEGTYFSFDRSEYAQLLDSGIVVMGATSISYDVIESPASITGTIRDRLQSNVLAEVDIGTGSVGCCVLRCNAELVGRLSQDYFEAAYAQLDRSLNQAKRPVVHRGLYVKDVPALQCYVMVGGVAAPAKRLAELSKKADLDHPVSGLEEFLRV